MTGTFKEALRRPGWEKMGSRAHRGSAGTPGSRPLPERVFFAWGRGTHLAGRGWAQPFLHGAPGRVQFSLRDKSSRVLTRTS